MEYLKERYHQENLDVTMMTELQKI